MKLEDAFWRRDKEQFITYWGYDEKGDPVPSEYSNWQMEIDANYVFSNKREEYQNKSLLFIAIDLGMNDWIPIILGHPQVDVNQRDSDGLTAIWVACRDKNFECLDAILSV